MKTEYLKIALSFIAAGICAYAVHAVLQTPGIDFHAKTGVTIAYFGGVVLATAAGAIRRAVLKIVSERDRLRDEPHGKCKDQGIKTTWSGSQSRRVIDILRTPKVRAELEEMRRNETK